MAQAMERLHVCLSDMPAWFQPEQTSKAEAGELVFWRLQPSVIAGRAPEPDH